MHPILVLAIAVSIVLAGILIFRLHAFLALTLAAFVVAMLTPAGAIQRFLLEKDVPLQIVEIGDRNRDSQISVTLRVKANLTGKQFSVLRIDEATRSVREVGSLDIDSSRSLGTVADDQITARFTPTAEEAIEVTDLVVHPLVYQAAVRDSKRTIGERVATAFGNTCGKIGILIALAAIIGKCLLDSGAADRIVRSALKVVGERGAPVAFVGSGFLLGIPVFFDTVFYLMMPLGKAMRMRTGRNYLLYVLTIVAGGSMAHSLVPPTPGPLLVAEELGIDLGLMILGGCCVGLCSSTAATIYAHLVNRRCELPLRESADFSLSQLEQLTQRGEDELPPLGLSVLPIVLPVILIAGNTVLTESGVLASGSRFASLAATLGNKNIALAIATALAIAMLVRQTRTSFKVLAESMQAALASGGVIILITAAGGAFGGMLQQTGVASLIRDLPQYSPLVVLILAFLITTAIRTAQGSATVAMITAVGILAGFAADGQLGCHPLYLALAIGCGSKPIAWMNDSGFWVICKMSGMTESEGLRYVTPMSILMGVCGLLATLVGAAVWPMN